MANRFRPARGLDETVARMVAPKVGQVARRVATTAKKPGYAPGTKAWVSIKRIRETHLLAEQENTSVPANLRFAVRTNDWEVRNRGVAPVQLAHRPRDPDLSPGERKNCGCRVRTDADGIRKTISALPPTLTGARVSAIVRCTHPRAVGAEFGEGQDEGTRFFGRALRDVAAGMR